VISADDLHAYVDGALPPGRRFAVALYLAAHPREAAAGEAFRMQIAGMKALFDPVLDEPVPPRLRRRLRARHMPRPRWLIAASMAAALVVAAGALVAKSHFAVVSATTIHIPAAARGEPPAARRLPVLPPPAGAPKRRHSADI